MNPLLMLGKATAVVTDAVVDGINFIVERFSGPADPLEGMHPLDSELDDPPTETQLPLW